MQANIKNGQIIKKEYQIIKLMLKNLFTKLKSEKSSTIKNEDINVKDQRKVIQNAQNLSQKQVKYQATFEQYQNIGKKLCEQSQYQNSKVKSQIKQVRYWENSEIPNIFNRILSCPISHYNLLPHSKRKVKQIDLKIHKFPEYLNFMKPLLQQELPTYNHILINHYPKGIGIIHHFDGLLYRDKVIVLSLDGPVVISFNEGYSKQKQNLKIFLQDKSIHIFQQDAYTKYLHGIDDNKVDSFTFRINRFDQNKKQKTNKMTNNGSDTKVNPNQEEPTIKLNQEYFISDCSIKNLWQLNSIKKLIQDNLNKLIFEEYSSEQQKYCIEFDKFEYVHKLKGCFIFINQNEQLNQMNYTSEHSVKNGFKWKIQIQRQQRISITIRQKYQEVKKQ